MRTELAAKNGQRSSYRGTFVRFGVEQTVLLTDVRDALGRQVADHLWFNLTREMEALALTNGVELVFDARVEPYEKGYKGRRELDAAPVETDYRLARPTNVRLVPQPAAVAPPWHPEPMAPPEDRKQLGLF